LEASVQENAAFDEVGFPLTPALSRRERENRRPPLSGTRRSGIFGTDLRSSLSSGRGSGWGGTGHTAFRTRAHPRGIRRTPPLLRQSRRYPNKEMAK